jgi:hypothetical protein
MPPDTEARIGGLKEARYETASELAAKSIRRGVLGNISSAFASFERFVDSLQRL